MDAIDPAYVCRRCGRQLSRRAGELACPNCGVTIPIGDGIPRFPVPDAVNASAHETVFDRLAPVYETPVWFQPLYRFVGGATAPRDDRSTIASMLALEAEFATEPAAEGDTEAPSVLDVACGTGRITRRVARDAASVLGVDISGGMLERARRYAVREGLGNVAFARMSADELWIDDGAFDRVACCWALHLFPDVDAALAELRRVLRPGGRLVGTTIVDEYVLGAAPVRAVARLTVGAEPFDVDSFRDRLREAGFSHLEFDRRGAALFFRARAE
ncbi:methyltransferase domain-containing protein [Haloterrigena sp. SYSU A121-1]|uniref:Methyltransferase domain-containing protein n=1 Tax=Haloterrigena gelatinilytica TaxID=2741724 RepID=A0A8J8KGC8_9EURY|nr:methyltransferase domain-containing protein [Haloterrigena gelatinilytica]NUB89879.1 methyltransferase domain-containing protein [Haloterrigena gelatinilytica]